MKSLLSIGCAMGVLVGAMWASPPAATESAVITQPGELTLDPRTGVVKKSWSGFCHDAASPLYDKTVRYQPFNTVEQCLKSGGRLPKARTPLLA